MTMFLIKWKKNKKKLLSCYLHTYSILKHVQTHLLYLVRFSVRPTLDTLKTVYNIVIFLYKNLFFFLFKENVTSKKWIQLFPIYTVHSTPSLRNFKTDLPSKFRSMKKIKKFTAIFTQRHAKKLTFVNRFLNQQFFARKKNQINFSEEENLLQCVQALNRLT